MNTGVNVFLDSEADVVYIVAVVVVVGDDNFTFYFYLFMVNTWIATAVKLIDIQC